MPVTLAPLGRQLWSSINFTVMSNVAFDMPDFAYQYNLKSVFSSPGTHAGRHIKRRHTDMRFIHYLDFHFLLSHMNCLTSQTGIALLQQLLDAGDVCGRLICACSISCAMPESCQGPRPDRVTFCASIQVDSWVNKLIVSLHSTPL